MRIQINNYSMSYESRGSGVPVLLIHGYPLNRKMWEAQISDLSDDALIIAPDLRGHGKSGSAPSPTGDPEVYSMDLHARDCAALLDGLGITQPVVIAGLSMGGYIAFSFLRKYPDRVAGLILAATRPGPDSSAAKTSRKQAVESALQGGIGTVVEAMLPKLLAPDSYKHRPDLVQLSESIIRETSMEGIVGDLRGMMDRPDSTPLLHNIHVPTLLIHGADDQIINLEEMETMQEAIPSAILHIIPGAGHLIPLEQPEIFTRVVRRYLVDLS